MSSFYFVTIHCMATQCFTHTQSLEISKWLVLVPIPVTETVNVAAAVVTRSSRWHLINYSSRQTKLKNSNKKMHMIQVIPPATKQPNSATWQPDREAGNRYCTHTHTHVICSNVKVCSNKQLLMYRRVNKLYELYVKYFVYIILYFMYQFTYRSFPARVV